MDVKIKVATRRDAWTATEQKYLQRWYPLKGTKMPFLQRHTKESIIAKACKLGLNKKIINKRCIHCKTLFKTNNITKKYCSPECRKIRSGRKTKKCLVCGKKFWVDYYRYKNAKFCSYKCMGRWESRYYEGRKNPNWRGGPKEYNCLVCGKTIISRVPSDVRKYCSTMCAQLVHGKKITGRKNPKWVEKILKVCEQCGKTFQVSPGRKRQFLCSAKCQSEWFKTSEQRNCLYCSKPFYAYQSKIKQGHGFYCSRKCLNKAQGYHRARKLFSIVSKILGTKRYQEEVTFNWLINPETNTHLYVDVYFPRYDLIVEYDGEQHYRPTRMFGLNYEESKKQYELVKKRDRIKNELIKKRGCNLLRIKYDEPLNISNISNKLKELL